MVKSDGANEIAPGVILALRDEGQVMSVQEYNNVVCIALLRYESETAGEESIEKIKRHAISTIAELQVQSPTLISQCDVHALLAQCDGRKHMKNKTAELKEHAEKFDVIFRHLALHLRHENRLSTVLARIAVVLTIFC